MKKIQYVKLDEDDILEILLEHFQERFENGEYATGIILGTPEKDLRFVGAFGSRRDKNFANIRLEAIDKQLPYNGDHAFLKANPEFCIKGRMGDA